ncbi:hypothetical protein EST38_g3353 [Candolleomyces aberdarensis]|uniref:Uncharacterized protein n=1 Tax=Candolleomyces aberdarensis TaxID=2316362 RepID=A0A4Q2DTR1_9AGAR|nr:hypothetical protein EST38_g3353 [Candolleomyces aberdarensis]
MNGSPFWLVLAWILLSAFDSSLICVYAFTLPHRPNLSMRDTIATGSGSGMSQHAAQSLAITFFVVAAVVGIVFYSNNYRSWYRRRRARPPAELPNIALPPFLRNRRVAGTVPVVFSPRTLAIVAADPALYSMPRAAHGVPHYTTNAQHATGGTSPLAPPPPAYSSADTQRA